MNKSLNISNYIINFSNNIDNNQISKIYITNKSNNDFIYKFLVKDNNLCFITPSKDIIKNNESKEIKINIKPDAINNINKLIIYALNTKYININDISDNIWTIYKHNIERYIIDVEYSKQYNINWKFIITIFIIIYVIILLFVLCIYFF